MNESVPHLPTLFEQHADFVRRLARRLLADEHAAEDLVQETWLTALERPPGHASALRGWLGTVARHLAYNQSRSSQRRRTREIGAAREEALESAAEQVGEQAVLRSVVDAVLALEEPHRSAIWMRFFREMSVREIAEELALGEPSVRSRVRRALILLRESLAHEHGDDPAWQRALLAVAAPKAAPWSLSLAGIVWSGAAAVLAAGALWLAVTQSQETGATQLAALGHATDPAPGLPADAVLASMVPQDGQRSEVVPTAGVSADALVLRGQIENLPYPDLELAGGSAASIQIQVADAHHVRYPGETDAEGHFEIVLEDRQGLGRFVRLLVDEDRTHRGAYPLLDVPAEGDLDFGTVTRAAHGVLRGRTVDLEGAPLGEVLVKGWTDWMREGEPVVVTSDEAGVFELIPAGALRHVDTEHPGHALVEKHELVRLDTGGLEPVDFVFAPAASVEVTVLRKDGTPVVGSKVTMAPAPAEGRDLEARLGLPARTVLNRKTDDHGRALFEAVPCGLQLSFGTQSDWRNQRDHDAVQEGVLGTRQSGGSPILLRPGERRSLEVRWSTSMAVEGTVLRQDGSAAVESRYELLDLGADREARERILAQGRVDTEGRFQLQLELPNPVIGPLCLVASESETKETGIQGTDVLVGLGYAGPSPPERDESLHQASRILTAPEEGPLVVELVLAPTLEIEGRLLDAEGRPIDLEESEAYVLELQGPSRMREPARPLLTEEGAFLFPGLEAGSYDLVIGEGQGTRPRIPTATHVFEGLEAGARGLRLELPEPRRTSVLLTAGEASAGEWNLLIGRRSRGPESGSPLRSGSVDRLDSWPSNIAAHREPSGKFETPDGDGSYLSFQVSTARLELPPLAPGWYRFGAASWAEDGTPLAPLATDWCRVDGGEVRLDFPFTATTNLTGHVQYEGPDRFFAVALVDASGRRMPLFPKGDPTGIRILDLGHGRTFDLGPVPVGTFELRLGTRAGLLAGEAERRLEVTLRPGEPVHVEL